MLELTWGQKNPEKWRKYCNDYYHQKYGEILRKRRFGNRKCRLCEIFMRSDYGGHNKKFYCDSCVESGEARKHTRRIAAQKFREKLKCQN